MCRFGREKNDRGAEENTEEQRKSTAKRGKGPGEWEDIRYRGNLTADILKDLPEEIVTQYFLWDRIMKKELELHPWLLWPLLEEVFRRTYNPGLPIILLATEYVVRKMRLEDGSTLNSLFADIVVRIGGSEIYHLECQMNREKGMVLRMLEYDVQIGLAQDSDTMPDGEEELPEVALPKSVILYLYPNQNLPAEEKCVIRFADGSSHEFRIPVVAVQQYSMQMIGEKHLNLLIPFLPIRFRPGLEKNKKRRIADDIRLKKDLTELVRECMMLIEREKTNGTLTDAAGKDLMELLDLACVHLLKDEPVLKEEVHHMLLPEIHLMRDDINQLEREKKQLKNKNEQLESEIDLLRKRIEELENANKK